MNRFGAMVQQIACMQDPLDQQRVLAHYLRHTPEPDRSAAISSPRKQLTYTFW